MPKEVLETFSGIEDYDGLPICLEVRWAKDNGGWVQVATINLRETPEWKATSGSEDDQDVEIPGWFMDLDRRSINKLIRILRRARDHSDPEGKDE